ncbi:MAG: DEAD/DEAH box helicase, partial [Actinobacteria bacterium]|nr:DEAD/DEAH box helicase [Actinomycetota bacterium]
MGVDGDIADALAAKGITRPFPIQELTLPMALKGADVIGQARTGTGKTLGFGLPLLQRIDTSSKRTQALVIVPTRELCIQVANDLEIGSARGVTSIAVYGGVPIEPQTDALVAGVHVVVGTPGRLLDHLNRGNLDLSNVTELVLDEADEMLDMGFLPDVERLIEATPQEGRHTMLFSATMPSTIVS